MPGIPERMSAWKSWAYQPPPTSLSGKRDIDVLEPIDDRPVCRVRGPGLPAQPVFGGGSEGAVEAPSDDPAAVYSRPIPKASEPGPGEGSDVRWCRAWACPPGHSAVFRCERDA